MVWSPEAARWNVLIVTLVTDFTIGAAGNHVVGQECLLQFFAARMVRREYSK